MPESLQERRTALALAALAEVTDPAEVGELLAVEQPGPGVVDLRFACTLAAYAGWSWIVSLADLPDEEPTVLEVELLPGDGALLAPPWVPWTERLAEWRRQHPDEQVDDEDDDSGVDASAEDESAEDEQDDDEQGDESDAEDDLDEDDLVVEDEIDDLDGSELDGSDLEGAELDGPELDGPDESGVDPAARPAREDRSL